MNVPFEKVLDGIAKYIDSEIYAGMNDWQELLARVAVGRVFENREALKTSLVNNGVIRTFAVIDDDGMVDVDGLIRDIKREIERKGSLEIKIPIFGKMKFVPSDVDTLYNTIMREVR